MTFELAKQLHDAGFPLRNAVKPVGQLLEESIDGIYYVYPTLPELIQASAGTLKALLPPHSHPMFMSWMAVDKIGEINAEGEWRLWSMCSGQTPEDAIAKLWLQVNKKAA